MPEAKTILVAPLHWGLGHATRCIPIIRALLAHNYTVIIASDGAALLLLEKEFPQLELVTLPSYEITYPKNGAYFKWKLFLKLPHIQRTIRSENNIVKRLVKDGKIHGIISDNRWGVRHKSIPSVFITHQLNVLSGKTTILSSKFHQKLIKKFDVCWVPDIAGKNNLSGILGHSEKLDFPIRYIGPLSRMKISSSEIEYDILVLLSGPEPQRTYFEEKLISELKNCPKRILLVQGMLAEIQETKTEGSISIINFMLSAELEKAICKSDFVISRSGYTTIMDLMKLKKKVFFVPTPGQHEQEYLAKHLKLEGIAPSCEQHKFSEKKLADIHNYKGLSSFKTTTNFAELFALFEGE